MAKNNDSKTPNCLFISSFEEMNDPRRTDKGNYIYPLPEILLLVISAVISGANGWSSIELFGKAKLAWLQQFLPYEFPIYSIYTKLQILFVW